MSRDRCALSLPFAACAASLFATSLAAQWSPVPASTGHPSARTGAALAELPGQSPDGLLLFGGTDGSTTFAEAWRWTGADWLRINSSTQAPRGRYGASLASEGNRLFLFGGAVGTFPGTFANDLWEYRAGTWASWSPASPPPPRTDQVFVAGPLGMVLFGGRDGSLRNDTWRLDVASMTWTRLSPPSAPSPRAAAAACFDAAHNVVLLFGGDAGNGTVLGDTWAFDGVGWRQLAPSSQPPGRRGAAMTFDADRGRVVMVGGLDAQGAALADTWEWLGSQWMLRSNLGTPAAGPAVMAHHGARGEDVLVTAGSGGLQVHAMQVAIKAFASDIGQSCRSSAASTLTALAPPVIGATLPLRVLAPVFGCLGLSRTRSLLGPLPQPVPIPGLSQCLQLVDVASIEFVGSSTWNIQVPNVAGLQGLRFYLQAVEINGPTLYGVSNGLECQFAASMQDAIDESFDNAAMLDRAASAGDWGNGFASFGQIGGDGRHGEFRPDLGSYQGQQNGKDTWLFQTDFTAVPASQTLDGLPATITDGQYYFTDMVVPANVRLVFAGTSPPRLNVRGRVQIDGDIDVSGSGTDYYLPPLANTAGQPGGVGGPFAGSGGDGGDRCAGNGATPANDGRNGGNARVLAGHAYAGSTAGTGGQGSALFPGSGQNQSLVFGSGVINYVIQAAAGGGGGGSYTAGGRGQVLFNDHVDPVLGVPPRLSFMGPPAPGGTAVQLFPLPPNARSSTHFLLGGAGGGGAGSQALFANNFIVTWVAGNGGGGGGGALALQAGDALVLASGAHLLANGGSCGDNISAIAVGQPQSAPAGAGAGGAIVLQAGRIANLLGNIDVRGGHGGQFDRHTVALPPSGGRVQIAGGDGGDGFVRLEMPGNPTPALLPGAQPIATAANVGTLTEQSDRSGFQSRFYPTGSPTPAWLRYEIDATVNGVPVRFSDDPGVGLPARFGSAPIAIWFQAAELDPGTGLPIPGSLSPWRPQVRAGSAPSLSGDAGSAARFAIVFDRSLGTAVIIDRVRIVYAR